MMQGLGFPAGSEARSEGGTQVVHDHSQWAQQGLTRRPQISLSYKSLIIPHTHVLEVCSWWWEGLCLQVIAG